MSIAPPTGAMSAYLARLVSGRAYRSLRGAAKQVARRLPKFFYDKARLTEEYGRNFWTGGTLFEELGFYYVGPIDGHNLDHLLPILKNVRDMQDGTGAGACGDQEGQGLSARRGGRRQISRRLRVRRHHRRPGQAEGQRAHLHARVRRRARRGGAARRQDRRHHRRHAERGPASIVFGEAFPERVFDVGIAEQHAVTFAAGLATEGYKPFCAIYSTFLQRAYDQVVHDVAIQNLPVRFAIDRAGLRRRRRPDACGLLRHRLSRLPAQHDGDGGGGRSRARPHGRDRRRP